MARTIDTAFHLVDARNWASVEARGLLSASRLMALAGQTDGVADRIHRPRGLQLATGAVIRDQSPMPPAALARCLRDGLQPADWYALLNSKVFFWLDSERLNRQRRACGTAPQLVLVFDAEALLSVYGEVAAVTPFNTGNAMRAAASRGIGTFVPYRRWVEDAWAAEQADGGGSRPRSHRPVELTIADAVPDALRFVVATVPLAAGETLTSDRVPRRRGAGTT